MAHIVKENGVTILRDDWYVEDVQDIDDDLTRKEAEKVLHLAAKTFNANIGINWDVIENCIDQVKGERK